MLTPAAEVVPNGVGELSRLVAEGYAILRYPALLTGGPDRPAPFRARTLVVLAACVTVRRSSGDESILPSPGSNAA